jgi:hypothetical protein
MGAHRAVPHQQLGDLLGHRPVHRVGHVDARSWAVLRRAQHPRQLGAVPGRRRTCAEQPMAQPVHQLGVRLGCDEFDLPLSPPLLGGVSIGGCGPRCGDLVITELGQRRTAGSVEHVDFPRGGNPCDRTQRAVPDNGQHDIQQLTRHIVPATVPASVRRPQRCVNLGAGVRPRRQFQMPSGVPAAGAAAQRDSFGRQVARRGVEVHRVQFLRRALLHPNDFRYPRE